MATCDTPEMKEVAFVVRRTREVGEFSEEAAIHCDKIQNLVRQAVALGMDWRGFIEYLAARVERGDIHGYRELADRLRPAANSALRIYEDVLKLARGSQGPICPVAGLADLQIAIHEGENIVEWINTWPSMTDEEYAAIHSEIDAGNTRPMKEFTDELATQNFPNC